jgi:hypothetical protein
MRVRRTATAAALALAALFTAGSAVPGAAAAPDPPTVEEIVGRLPDDAVAGRWSGGTG